MECLRTAVQFRPPPPFSEKAGPEGVRLFCLVELTWKTPDGIREDGRAPFDYQFALVVIAAARVRPLVRGQDPRGRLRCRRTWRAWSASRTRKRRACRLAPERPMARRAPCKLAARGARRAGAGGADGCSSRSSRVTRSSWGTVESISMRRESERLGFSRACNSTTPSLAPHQPTTYWAAIEVLAHATAKYHLIDDLVD